MLSAQSFRGFETLQDMHCCQVSGGTLALDTLRAKQGQASLRWDYLPSSHLDIALPPALHADAYAMRHKRSGIQLWLYNDVADGARFTFSFLNADGLPLCSFDYLRATAGWRAVWIDFSHIEYGDSLANSLIRTIRLTAPASSGQVWVDRLTFPVPSINERTTPDAQLPHNNSLPDRPIWHWCRVWEWSHYPHHLTPHKSLSPDAQSALRTIERRLDRLYMPKVTEASTQAIALAQTLYASLGFKERDAHLYGPHLVSTDECDHQAGDMDLTDLDHLLYGFGLDAYLYHHDASLRTFLALFDFAMEEGFAWGSGMGTNHHYGYKISDLYPICWALRKEILRSPQAEAIIRTLTYWSALAETRQLCVPTRDERVDTWHTLLMPKLFMAMYYGTDSDRDLKMRELRDWISSSLSYTGGTIGGIKSDGTVFHHGGFYPAYATGAFASIGRYMTIASGTPYMLSERAIPPLSQALRSAAFYSEVLDFPINLAGRHPFHGHYTISDLTCYADIALDYPTSPEAGRLASLYLHLMGDRTTTLVDTLRSKGYRPYLPEGFRLFNYGATAAYRLRHTLAVMKGFNHHVWGSEIYAHDNRFGRYLSYGSLILQFHSRRASGYVEAGYDWSRIPGTTSVYLPLDQLRAPLRGTMMVRNLSPFSGGSTLDRHSGLFAIEIDEAAYPTFTPSFHARKSVFCFGSYLLCMGTDIRDDNERDRTETTLFQVASKPHVTDPSAHCISDGYGNYYLFADQAPVHLYRHHQQHSRDNKDQHDTLGTFDLAVWDHGVAPHGASYLYTILPESSADSARLFDPATTYRLLAMSDHLHGVEDLHSATRAYVAFEESSLSGDPLLSHLPPHTLAIWKPLGTDEALLSICDPDLNLGAMSYTTPLPSRPHEKVLTLHRGWRWQRSEDNHTIRQDGDRLTVLCVEGKPTIIKLHKTM